MRTVVITIGWPGSGKSTWARQQLVQEPKRWKRVNKDELRAMIDGDVWDHDKEKFVSKIQERLLLDALKDGYDVIVDNTNLNGRVRRRLHDLCKQVGDVKIIEKMFQVPWETCVKRNEARDGRARVPDGAMKSFYDKHKGLIRRGPAISETYYPPLFVDAPEGHVKQDPTLPRAILCDLDGTLANIEWRNPYDATECDKDGLNEPVAELVKAMHAQGRQIIFVSGRLDKYKPQTVAFIEKHLPGLPYRLLMRKTGDMRKDSIIKREIYDENIRSQYFVEFVVDDRPQVVRMWRYDLGFWVMQVNDKEF